VGWKRKQKTYETRRVKWLWCADGYVQKAYEKADLELSGDEDFVVIFLQKLDICGVT